MPQRIDVPLLKTLIRCTLKSETEIRDSEQAGFTVRALPSGGVRFYAVVSRGRREVVAHEHGSGRWKTESGLPPVDARDVLDRGKKEISLKWVRDEVRRLQGEAIGGTDRSADRRAKRGIPTLAQAMDENEPDSYAADVRDKFENPNTKEHRDGEATLERIRSCFLSGEQWGNFRLDEIDKAKMRKYIRRRLKKVTPGTVVRDVAALRALMNWYVKETEILAKNPFAGATLPKTNDDDEQKIRALEPQEQSALLKALTERDKQKADERASGNKWREQRDKPLLPSLDGKFCDYLTPAIIFCLNTGLRPEELYGLEWRDITKWKSVHVRRDNSKTFTERTIPLNSAARDAVRQWFMQRGQPKAGYVFAGKGGRLTSMKKGFYAALEAAGIERIRADGKEVRPKSLRHSFGTNSIRAGVDLKTLAKLMGHKDIRTTAMYLHTDRKAMQAAVDRLATT